jgi:hypothetical protein
MLSVSFWVIMIEQNPSCLTIAGGLDQPRLLKLVLEWINDLPDVQEQIKKICCANLIDHMRWLLGSRILSWWSLNSCY